MATCQLYYTFNKKSYKGDQNHPDLAYQIRSACVFTTNTAFNLAHWFFAFSYLVLSFRLDLAANKLPEDTHNCRFNTVNIIVCLFNVAIPAIYWVYEVKGDYKAGTIAGIVE